MLLQCGYKWNTRNVYLTWIFAIVWLVKFIVLIIITAQYAHGYHRSLTATPFEAFICLLVELKYQNNIGYLIRTIPKFAILMMFFALSICIYTSLFFLLFQPTSEEATQYFPTFGTGVWNMLMVLIGSNWPGPVIPAYNSNHISCLYFFMFIIIYGWFFLNLILGFVFLYFKNDQLDVTKRVNEIFQSNLDKAFLVLDTERVGFLTYNQMMIVLQEMYQEYKVSSHPPSKQEIYELILILDIQSNLMIDRHDFRLVT